MSLRQLVTMSSSVQARMQLLLVLIGQCKALLVLLLRHHVHFVAAHVGQHDRECSAHCMNYGHRQNATKHNEKESSGKVGSCLPTLDIVVVNGRLV